MTFNYLGDDSFTRYPQTPPELSTFAYGRFTGLDLPTHPTRRRAVTGPKTCVALGSEIRDDLARLLL